MSTATVSTRPIARWLTATLRADGQLQTLAPGGVWEDQMPQTNGVANPPAWPAVVFQFLSGSDTRPAGVDFIDQDCTYVVKVIDRAAEYLAAEVAFSRVLALLDNAAGMSGPNQIYFCQRQRPVQYPETAAGGREYRHLGGQFRIKAH